MWTAWSRGNALRGHGRNAYSADTFLTVGKCVGVSVRGTFSAVQNYSGQFHRRA